MPTVYPGESKKLWTWRLDGVWDIKLGTPVTITNTGTDPMIVVEVTINGEKFNVADAPKDAPTGAC